MREPECRYKCEVWTVNHKRSDCSDYRGESMEVWEFKGPWKFPGVRLRHLLQDDVDVTGDELGNLLPLSGLNGVVALLVLPKVLQTSTWSE